VLCWGREKKEKRKEKKKRVNKNEKSLEVLLEMNIFL
jgi:hypothetical protein